MLQQGEAATKSFHCWRLSIMRACISISPDTYVFLMLFATWVQPFLARLAPSCRDRGRMTRTGRGLVPVLLRERFASVSRNPDESDGEEGQAQGPLIHSSLPSVPTGRRAASQKILRFGC